MANQEFVCLRCGVCCSKFQACLTLDETRQIADKLNITREKFIEEYTDPRWPGTQSWLIRHKNGACIFLQRNSEGLSLCTIHQFKPTCCREWKAGPDKSECSAGLTAGKPIFPHDIA